MIDHPEVIFAAPKGDRKGEEVIELLKAINYPVDDFFPGQEYCRPEVLVVAFFTPRVISAKWKRGIKVAAHLFNNEEASLTTPFVVGCHPGGVSTGAVIEIAENYYRWSLLNCPMNSGFFPPWGGQFPKGEERKQDFFQWKSSVSYYLKKFKN